jgi:hypothetical protein
VSEGHRPPVDLTAQFAQQHQPPYLARFLLDPLADRDVLDLDFVAEPLVRLAEPRASGAVEVIEHHPAAVEAERLHHVGLQPARCRQTL